GALTTNSTVDAVDRTTRVAVDPNGANRTTTISYGANDEVATTTETDSTGANRTASYTYDAMGNKLAQSVNMDGAGHPVGWYPLTQTSGSTVIDSSGTGNTANASGVTWTGSSASFAGAAGQQIATNGPVLDTTQNFTVSAWVNAAAFTTGD